MSTPEVPDPALRLLRAELPLLYTLIGLASPADQELDDAFEQILRRTLDDTALPPRPEKARPRLLATVLRHLDEVRPALPAAETGPAGRRADFTVAAIAGLALTGQRREAVEATRWLGAQGRNIFALWWLEVAGELTRADLLATCDLPAEEAADQVRAAEERLEEARAVVRSLADPLRCAQLGELASRWDGRPSERWRRRFARHVRDCAVCSQGTAELIPADRLLRGFPLVPVPPVLADRVLARYSEPVAVKRSRRLAAPLMAAAAALVLFGAGATVYAATRPNGEAPGTTVESLTAGSTPPDVVAAPPAPASPSTTRNPERSKAPTSKPTPSKKPPASPKPTYKLPASFLGEHSFEAAADPGHSIREDDDLAFLGAVNANSSDETKSDASFLVVTGLEDNSCFSFRDRFGRFLRHRDFRLRMEDNDGSELFKKDTTFCVKLGSRSGTVYFQPINYPDRFLRWRDDGSLRIDPLEASDAYDASRSFAVIHPWG